MSRNPRQKSGAIEPEKPIINYPEEIAAVIAKLQAENWWDDGKHQKTRTNLTVYTYSFFGNYWYHTLKKYGVESSQVEREEFSLEDPEIQEERHMDEPDWVMPGMSLPEYLHKLSARVDQLALIFQCQTPPVMTDLYDDLHGVVFSMLETDNKYLHRLQNIYQKQVNHRDRQARIAESQALRIAEEAAKKKAAEEKREAAEIKKLYALAAKQGLKLVSAE